MRSGIFIFISAIIGVLMVAIVMTIGGHQVRSGELQENLSGAVENAVLDAVTDKESLNTAEMLAEAAEQLSVVLDSDMETELLVYQAEADMGILSASAKGNYMHPNGEAGDVMWERMAIYEKGDEEEMKQCEVRFYKDKETLLSQGSCYKLMRVLYGSCAAKPVQPKKEGLVFAGWRDSNDYIADFSQAVTGDIVYYAAWE